MPPAGAPLLTGFQQALLYLTLGVYGGASLAGARLAWGRRSVRGLKVMLCVGTIALTIFLTAVALRSGHLPVRYRFELLALSAWVVAGILFFVDRKIDQPLLAAAAAPTLLLLTLFTVLLVPTESAAGAPARLGTVFHVVLAVLSCGALTFAALVGALYLWQIRILKRNPSAAVSRRMPPLESLDRLNFVAVLVGFPLLVLSAVAGWLFVVGQKVPDSRLLLDPTVLATLAGLLVYVILFAARLLLGWRGRRVAWLTVVGFLLVVVGFFVASFCTAPGVIHTL